MSVTTSTFQFQLTPTFPTDGVYTVLVTATDPAGNTGSTQRNFTRDTTPPDLRIAEALMGDNVINMFERDAIRISGTSNEDRNVSVTLNGTSTLVFPPAVVSGGAWESIRGDNGSLADGTYMVRATQSDQNGNVATVEKILNVDTVVSPFSVTTASSSVCLNKQTAQSFVVSGRVETRGSVNITGSVSQNLIVPNGNEWSTSFNVSNLSGNQNILISGMDVAGNKASANLAFCVDVEAPSIEIYSPLNATVFNSATVNNVNVAGQTERDATAALIIQSTSSTRVPLSLDGDGKFNVTISLISPSGSIAEGNVTLSVESTDAAGNVGVKSVVVQKRTVPPSISIASPTSGETWNAAKINSPVQISGTSTGESVNVTIGFTNGFQTTVSANMSGNNWNVSKSFSLNDTADGSVRITANALDQWGNTNSATVEISLDTVARVTFAKVSGDNIISTDEATDGFTISGTVERNSTLVANIGAQNRTYFSPPAGEAIQDWQIGGLTLANGTMNVSITITATDQWNNTQTLSQFVLVRADNLPVTINPVTADNIVNGQECSNFVVSGTRPSGSNLTVSIKDISEGILIASSPIEASAETAWNISFVVLCGVIGANTTNRLLIVEVVAGRGVSSGSAELQFVADFVATGTEIDPITDDNILNLNESLSFIFTGRAEPLAGVNLTLTDSQGLVLLVTNFTANDDGRWSAPPRSLSALSDGQVNVTATQTDKAGNTAQTSLIFNLTRNIGAIEITSPQAGATLGTTAFRNLLFRGSGPADRTLQYTLSTPGTTLINTFLTAAGNWTVGLGDRTNLPDGTYTLLVSLSTVEGNYISNQTTFFKDTTAPVVILTSPQSGTTVNQYQIQNLTIEGSISASRPIATANACLVDRVPNSACTSLNLTDDFTFDTVANTTGLVDGTVTVQVVTFDELGNRGENNSVIVLDRMVQAEVQLRSSSLINQVQANNLTLEIRSLETFGTLQVNVTATDVRNSTVFQYQSISGNRNFVLNVSTLSDGPLVLQVHIVDNAGNVRDWELLGVVLDKTLQVSFNETLMGDNRFNRQEAGAVVLSGSSDPNTTYVLQLNGEPVTGGVFSQFNWTLVQNMTTVPDGNVTVTLVASDAAGNSLTVNTTLFKNTGLLSITLDKPVHDGFINKYQENTNITLSGSASLNVTKITVSAAGETWSVIPTAGNWTTSFSASNLMEGEASITVMGSDVDGNTATDSATIIKDTIPPALQVDIPEALKDLVNQSDLDADVILRGQSDVDRAIQVQLYFNGNLIHNISIASLDNSQWSDRLPVPKANGEASLLVSQSDLAGNWVERTFNFSVLVQSTFNLTHFATINKAQADSLLVGGLADRGAVTVTVQHDDYPDLTLTASTSPTSDNTTWAVSKLNLTDWNDGDIVIRAVYVDRAGNQYTDRFLAKKDTQAPRFEITGTGRWLNNLTASSFHLSGLGESGLPVNFTISMGNVSITDIATVENGVWSAPISLNTFPDGNLTIYAWQEDEAGNRNTSIQYVYLDRQPPTLNITSVSGDDYVSRTELNSLVPVLGTVESGSSVTVTIQVSGSNFAVVNVGAEEISEGRWSAMFNLSSIGEGYTVAKATARDPAGNEITTQLPFKVESPPCPTPSPSSSPSSSPPSSSSPSPTPTSSVSSTPSSSSSFSPVPTPSPSPSASLSLPPASRSASSSVSLVPSRSVSNSPAASVSSSPSFSSTVSLPSRSASSSSSASVTRTSTSSPTRSATVSESSSASSSRSRPIILLPPDAPSPSSLPSRSRSVGSSASPSSVFISVQPAPSRSNLPSSSPMRQQVPAGTNVEVPIELDNRPVGVVRIPPEQKDDLELTIVLNSPLPPSRNGALRDGVVADITLQDASGRQITSFDTPLTICLAPDKASRDKSCLSYYDEERSEWVCQDECLKEENGLLCGETDHLTSFALLLSGGAGNECESTNYIYSWLTLGFVCATLLVVVLSVIAIELNIRFRRVNRRRVLRSIATENSRGSMVTNL